MKKALPPTPEEMLASYMVDVAVENALDMSEVELAAASVDPEDIKDIHDGLAVRGDALPLSRGLPLRSHPPTHPLAHRQGHDGGIFGDVVIGQPLNAEEPNHHPKPPEPRRSSIGNLAYYLLSPNLDPVEYEPPEEVVMDESMWGVSILIFTWPMGALCSAALLFLLFLNICMQVLFIYL